VSDEYPDLDRMQRALYRVGIIEEGDDVPDDEIVDLYRVHVERVSRS
jgi:hypothetical protein